MLPEIIIGTFSIPTFSLCAIVGVTVFVLIILVKLHHYEKSAIEAYFILPKIFISFGIGFAGAIFFDALFKIPQNGDFRLAGITFYGGAITGIAVLSLLIAFFKKNSRLSLASWLNLLTVPFLVFHLFGRIGCFLGGCCYGKVTYGPFGILFPDNPSAGIFHNGLKVYPTQLFEAVGLALLAIILSLIKKHKFLIYCFAYPIMRFCLEFLRGDNRGSYFGIFSPSQLISILIVSTAATVCLIKLIKTQMKELDGIINP